MISPELQRLDEALTAAGHDENCAAYQGGPCSGVPLCNGDPVPGMGATTQLRPHSAMTTLATASGPMVTLTGAAALAYSEYQAAAKELKAATELHQRVQQRYNDAHRAFMIAAADG